MRTAAVDYGRRRIGLAISDPLGITVRGLDTVVRGPDLAEAVAAVAERLRESGAGRVVVGLPLLASGDESEMSREARLFGAALSEALGLEVEFFDESLTSWEAEESLREAKRNVREAQRSGEVDRQAAVALLRSWLRERESSPPAGADETTLE
jgi:putative Holliday junction resolvase